ncbi:MAG TPA: hypothetical protein V6D11_29720 [Waterburya sp.]
MNSISFKLVSFLLGLTALTVVSSTGSAQAQTARTNSSFERSTATVAPMPVDAPTVTSVASTNLLPTNTTPPVEASASDTPVYAPLQTAEAATKPVTTPEPAATNPTVAPTSSEAAAQLDRQQTNTADINVSPADTQSQRREAVVTGSDQPTSPETTSAVNTTGATPGTVSTSAASLTEQPQTSSASEASTEQGDTSVAQGLENVDIEPGRATRGGRSYIGIGGAIGLTGGTGIGQGGFLINSKIGLTRNVSFRPSVVIGDATDFLLPLTYDFILQSADPFRPVPFAPFLGGGVAFSTDSGNEVGFLLTGGADFPLSRQFVANAAVNAGFFGDSTSVGISLGVGYQFSGF